MFKDIFENALKNCNPVEATIELLTKCNWNCKHCYIPVHNNDGLTTDEVFKLLYELREMGVFQVTFSGGEVFYRSDAMKIIRKARELHFDVSIFTNASLLTEEMIIELSKLYISQISCTIFSMDEEIHNSISRKSGSLRNALRNIELAKKHEIPVQVKSMVMKENHESIAGLKDYCEMKGYPYKFDPVIFTKLDGNTSPLKLRLSADELAECIPITDEVNGVDLSTKSIEDYMCPSIRSSFSINSNGDVIPCNVFPVVLGNVKSNNISDIWKDSKQLKILQETKWIDLNTCKSCEKTSFCVRCPGLAMYEDGDMFGPSSSACSIAEVRQDYFSK